MQKCRRKMIGELVEECSENIDENGSLDKIALNVYKSNSYTLYIVLFAVFYVTNTVISTVFIYFYWY